VKPSFITMVRSASTPGAPESKVIYKNQVEQKQVLDPRVAYLMTNLMEEVLRSGTGAGVRAKLGYNVPAAGKTGTSHDGWFAGFTSKLLCIVWVGFDDGRDLDLEGAHSALPVWAEFMKRAAEHPEYHNVSEFSAPAGVVGEQIDPGTGQLATSACPRVITEYFIEGTQPVEMCQLHGGGAGAQVAGWDTGTPPSADGRPRPNSATNTPASQQGQKKGIFDRLRDLFK